MIPAYYPSLSPNDRVIAKPGPLLSSTQTLNGPYEGMASIIPPFEIILLFSS